MALTSVQQVWMGRAANLLLSRDNSALDNPTLQSCSRHQASATALYLYEAHLMQMVAILENFPEILLYQLEY